MEIARGGCQSRGNSVGFAYGSSGSCNIMVVAC